MKVDRVNWLTIKWLCYLKEDQEMLLFKYRMADDFKQQKIKGSILGDDRRLFAHVCHVAIAVSFCCEKSGRRICWIFATWGWYHKSITSSANLTH